MATKTDTCTEPVKILRQSFGPETNVAGAVFAADVLRCRCGSIQRSNGRKSSACLRCRDGIAFATPSPAGFYWLEGRAIPDIPWAAVRPCVTCGAPGREPCWSTGRLMTQGTVMKSVHAARKLKDRR